MRLGLRFYLHVAWPSWHMNCRHFLCRWGEISGRWGRAGAQWICPMRHGILWWKQVHNHRAVPKVTDGLHHLKLLSTVISVIGLLSTGLVCPVHRLQKGFLFTQISGHDPIKILIALTISKPQDNLSTYLCEFHMLLIHVRSKCPVTKFNKKPCYTWSWDSEGQRYNCISCGPNWNNHHRKWSLCWCPLNTRHRGLCQNSEAHRAPAQILGPGFSPCWPEVPFLPC